MGKKVREYKSGDFIFAKVKGYPAWPARVQRMNGKKYFVYFYGTGEIANLPPNMIFDYAENKDKFLTKTVKRRDFNDGVKQIEHDFANNVPLEQVIGIELEAPAADTTLNDTGNETMEETVADSTAADDTIAEETASTTATEAAVEDSDDAGPLVIDEGKQKGRKSKVDGKTPATPKAGSKTPRGKAKKDDVKDDEDDRRDEEIVSRSGRKIRPKRYIDEKTDENATLPSPAPKKRRGASPAIDNKDSEKEKSGPKNMSSFNAVPQSELENLKEPFKSDDPEKENLLITYLPNGQYVGIKLFQSRPASFKNDAARLQWEKQAASNAITLKGQLEQGHITSQSVLGQLVMQLHLTDDERTALDRERETEEKRSRVQFLKTEMKLIELDAKIKTCLCLEKADTDLCLKLLDELMELDVKPLMLLKHPSCLETVKRMRAYVGNTPSWDLSETAALVFSKQAHRIRKQADALYKNMKDMYSTPEGLSFWEYFSERVIQFKKVTAKLTSDELLELVHEPLEMSVPTSHTMKSAVETANEGEPEDDDSHKKKNAPAKAKKTPNNTPAKTPLKRQSSRKQQQEEKEKEKESEKETENEKEMDTDPVAEENETVQENNVEQANEQPKESEKSAEDAEESVPTEENDKQSNDEEIKNSKESESSKETESESKDSESKKEVNNKELKETEAEVSKEDKAEEKEKEKEVGEPRAKRSRDSKKTEPPPPRSPAKRKSKV